MGKGFAWIVVIFGGAFLVYLMASNYDPHSDYATIDSGKDQVRAHAKDPSSVTFNDAWVGSTEKGKVACGTFNAKNSFGAYTGNQRFIVGGDMVATDENAKGLMDGLWQKLCASSSHR